MNSQRERFRNYATSEIKLFETSRRMIYAQVFTVTAAFILFVSYLIWIYPSIPEIIPIHFDINWTPNRWAHKSELFIVAGIAAIFPAINTILVLKFGRYGKELMIFLGVIFLLAITLFFGIIYTIKSMI